MQNPCVAEKCAKPAELRWLSYFKWLILGLLLLLFLLLRSCGLNAITAPIITAPLQGAVELGGINLAGTGSPNSAINILKNGNTIAKTAVDNDGNWGVETSLKEAGTYGFIAQALDADGNVAATSKELSLTIPPAVVAAVTPLISSPVAGNIDAGMIVLSGIATPETDIEILQNNAPIGKTHVDADGNWKIDIASLTEAGTYGFIAKTIESDGKEASTSKELSLTILPAVAAVVAPIISSPVNGEMNSGTLELIGTAAPKMTLEILRDNTSIGKTEADDDGNWTLETSLTKVGTYAFIAQTLDNDEKSVATSNKLSLTIAPIAVAITPVITFPENGEIKTGSLEVKGTAEPNTNLDILLNDTSIGKTSVDSEGQWTINTELDVAGKYFFIANAINEESEVTATSNMVTLTLPDLAPISPVIVNPENGEVKAGIVKISGTGEADTTLDLLQNNTSISQVEVNSDGKWISDVELSKVGKYIFIAQTMVSGETQAAQSNQLLLNISSVDTDKDGVSDANDLCPNSAVDAVVDNLGCTKTKIIVLEGVNFKTNSAKLTSKSLGILDQVASSLSNITGMKLEIAGHTDSDGLKVNNQRLSQQRAEAVVAYLKNNSVDTSNMTAKGYGESKPIASNTTREGKAKNRRVELNRL